MNQSEIILHPGELAFKASPYKLRTILGSCVSITVWHPALKIGGMCHFVLSQPKEENKNDYKNDYRYGSVALKELARLMKVKAKLNEYKVGVFGGSNMFPTKSALTVGQQNVAYAFQWVRKNGLQLNYESTLGEQSRILIMNIENGDISLRCSTKVEGV